MIRLILEAVKEWVEELLNGFVKKGNAEDSKSITGRYNVLDYGLKGDGTTDNTVALQNMINSVPAGAIIFFPAGVYNITDTIEIAKGATFVGESFNTQRMINANTLTPDSQINYIGTDSNITLFKRLNNVSFNVEKLAFFGNSYGVARNDSEFTALPHHEFTETIIDNKENINCIDYVEGKITVKDCMFIGFSGYALKIGVHNYVKNCGFFKCQIGIMEDRYDSLIENCWFSSGKIGILCKNTTENYTSMSISDCWCDQMLGHFIKVEGQVSSMLLVDNAWVDMIDGAGISVDGQLHHSRINGRLSRCGMMYAGIDDNDRTTSIQSMTDAINASAIYDSSINISIDKRRIGNGNNKDGVCPSKAISSNTNVIKDSNIVCIDTAISDICELNGALNNTRVLGKDSNILGFSIWNYTDAPILFRTSSPLGKVQAPKPNCIAIDTVTGDIYRSTAASDTNAWESLKKDPTDIDFSDIEGV